MGMSEHNQLNWTDFLLCLASEMAYYKNGERPIQEQMVAEKIIELQEKYCQNRVYKGGWTLFHAGEKTFIQGGAIGIL